MNFFENQSNCEECGLYKSCQHKKEGVYGKGGKKIFILSDWNNEDTPTDVNAYISNLQFELIQYGVDLEKDCWHSFAIACFNDLKASATKKQLGLCRPNWDTAIRELKPEKILVMGEGALNSFLLHRMKEVGGMGKWVGFSIPDQEYQSWVFPLFHPYQVSVTQKMPALSMFHKKSFKNVLTHKKKFVIDSPQVRVLIDLNKVIVFLERLHETDWDLLSLDLEGTGLKPHRKEQKIKTLAFSHQDGRATAFPMFEDWRFLDLLEMILTSDKPKTAHNMKFEHSWFKEKFGYDIRGWEIDTMIGTHIVDHRGGTTGLKFQTYVQFGVAGYDLEVEKWITTTKEGEDSKSGNRLNKIEEGIEQGNLDEILYYNGLDAIYGRKCALQQLEIFNNDSGLMQAYELFHEGVLAFQNMEEKGWKVREELFDKYENYLKEKENFWTSQVNSSKEVEKFKNQTGKDEFNQRSSPQKQEMFLNVLGCKVLKLTEKENPSMDKEVLSKYAKKHNIAKYIQEQGKIKTLLDRLQALKRESVDGVVHPSYNLHTAMSYRSSCSDPNQQNNPKRDKSSAKIIRSCVIPRKGRMLLSKDFSGIEVAIGCCYHKDPKMIQYVSDETTDMHRDTAVELFFLNGFENQFFKSGMGKVLRYEAKNKFVFPQFYGDWYKTCAKNLWESIEELKINEVPVKEWLIQHNIKTFSKFESHVKSVEDSFWKNRFRVYNKWKWDFFEEYLQKGYVEFLTGFRATGLMNRKQVCNAPIQGTAFHVLLWTLIQVQKVLIKEKWSSFIIGQIHDDTIFDVQPEELEDLNKLVDKIGTEDIKKEWGWINIPLKIEAEVSKIDGNWFEMEELK